MKKIIIFIFLCYSYIFGLQNIIKWQYELEDAKELAKEFKKPIFLFLESRKCYYCPIMKEKTFVNKKVIKSINRYFIPVMLDNSLGAESDVENSGHAPERLTTSMTPAIYFMGPNEEKLSKKGAKHMIIYGMWNSKEILEWIEDAKRKYKQLYGYEYDK